MLRASQESQNKLKFLKIQQKRKKSGGKDTWGQPTQFSATWYCLFYPTHHSRTHPQLHTYTRDLHVYCNKGLCSHYKSLEQLL